MFSEQDKKQIKDHGLELDTVESQITNFKNGFPPSKLVAPAVSDDGLLVLSEADTEKYVAAYEAYALQNEVVKFVPASGAASRMFKKLFAFKSSYDASEAFYQELISDQSSGSMFEFFKKLEDFAFYDDLKTAFATSGVELAEAHVKREYVQILEYLLEDTGLGYGKLPKGLLKFHSYGESARTPVEEHMSEGVQYAKSKNDEVHLHFTVSPEHQPKFEKHVSEVKSFFEKEFGVSIKVGYSVQKPATDTIAVDMDNEPFREPDGSLLFRPAGHGALLENLNDINADVVFIKNIDNVVPDHLKKETVTYKKAIGGVLVSHQEKIFNYLEQLESKPEPALLKEIRQYISNYLGTKVNETAGVEDLMTILNRPIRVCGMVKSEGDPGGGPFWVADEEGTATLQIVETAQIDLSGPGQNEVFTSATHFNPVDLVCAVKDHKGQKFDLMKYRDPQTGFITAKSKDGKDLKAQELPGLWNGSMAYWNSIFVEVPIITFNPVKSVSDLLKKEHQ